VFGITTYAYIFSNLYLLKFGLKVTYLIFIGYFNTRTYKLLNKKINIVYSKQNIWFEKKEANLVKVP